MKIAISGCGIAGTATACLLARQGHEVTILEQASQCQPVGAGILLQPSGQKVLSELGILDDLAGVSERLDGLLARRKSGQGLVRLKYQWLDKNLYGLGVHRGRLFQRLLQLCQEAGVQVVTSARVVDYQSSVSGVVVATADGREHGGYDFLIAADGSRSELRGPAGIASRHIDYEYAALWATGPCEFQPGMLVQIVHGTQQLAGLLPIGGGHASFFWGLPAADWPQLRNADIDSWKQEVLAVCPESRSMLDGLAGFEDLTFARYRHVSMSRWYADHIVFLGDAAHASSPHLGQGVNLALEDAQCFTEALAATADFGAACRHFTRRRRRKVRYYSQLTRLLSPFFQSHGRLRAVVRNTFLPWFPRTPLVRREMIRTLCGYKNGWLG